MCHECTKQTRLPLGVAKYKESTNQRINSICHHAYIKTRLLWCVTKKKRDQMAYDMNAHKNPRGVHRRRLRLGATRKATRTVWHTRAHTHTYTTHTTQHTEHAHR